MNTTNDENVKNNNDDNDNDDNEKDNDDVDMLVDKPNVFTTDDIRQLSALLRKSFVAPWTKHLNDVEDRLTNANLAKYATSRIKSKATDKAAAIVADEPSATPQIMSELIKKAVSKETEQLLKKLSKLEQQLSRSTISKPTVSNNNNIINNKAKNDTRGEKKTRASTPKKSKTKAQPNNNNYASKKKLNTSTAKSKPKRKAEDANNDTRKSNNKSSNNKSNKKSNNKTNNTKRTNSNNNKMRNRV